MPKTWILWAAHPGTRKSISRLCSRCQGHKDGSNVCVVSDALGVWSWRFIVYNKETGLSHCLDVSGAAGFLRKDVR
jgi:hypothetical protein